MAAEPHNDPWTLSAIESLALLAGPMMSETAAAGMAITELVVRRALVLSHDEQPFLLVFNRRSALLSPGPAFGLNLPEPLKRVLERNRNIVAWRLVNRGTAVSLAELSWGLFTPTNRPGRFPKLFRQKPPVRSAFVSNVVMPSLQKRGLFRLAEGPTGIFAGSFFWEITAEGMAELERLRKILIDGRQHFSFWVNEDPERAARYVEEAGSAMLLSPGLAPLIRVLHARIAASNTSTPFEPETAMFSTSVSNDRSLPVNAFGLVALAGVFGPGEFDGLDSTFHFIAEGVAEAWDAFLHACDPGAGG